MPQINNGTNLVSYKETEITLGPKKQYVYQNPYNSFRVLSSTGTTTDLTYRFGASSIETQLTVGVGLDWPEVLPSVTITNTSSATVTIRVSSILGQVSDNRLTITGTVTSTQVPDTVRQTSLKTFDANGEVQVDSTSYKNVLIQNMSETDAIHIFANNQFEVLPKGVFYKNYAGQFKVYGTTGQKISVGYFS